MREIDWTDERRETVELCRRERKLARSRMDPRRRAEYDRNMRQDRRRFER